MFAVSTLSTSLSTTFETFIKTVLFESCRGTTFSTSFRTTFETYSKLENSNAVLVQSLQRHSPKEHSELIQNEKKI